VAPGVFVVGSMRAANATISRASAGVMFLNAVPSSLDEQAACDVATNAGSPALISVLPASDADPLRNSRRLISSLIIIFPLRLQCGRIAPGSPSQKFRVVARELETGSNTIKRS
jgi:hypothetical protein